MNVIKQFVSNNINNNVNINEVKILIMFEKTNGTQIHIDFSSLLSFSASNITSCVKLYENYLYIHKEETNISIFGSYINIISSIINDSYNKFLNKYRNIKENLLLKIIVKKNNYTNISKFINKNNCLKIINKSENTNSTHLQCPVCISNYNNFYNYKINLPCNHCICISCFYTLSSHNEKNCPICRNTLIN